VTVVKEISSPAPETIKTLDKSVDKVGSEVVKAVTDQLIGKDTTTTVKTVTTTSGVPAGTPPGLAKKGGVPPGLAKKGVTTWSPGSTQVVEVKTEQKESLIQKWVKSLFAPKEKTTTAN
jgi:hypothetical protein